MQQCLTYHRSNRHFFPGRKDKLCPSARTTAVPHEAKSKAASTTAGSALENLGKPWNLENG